MSEFTNFPLQLLEALTLVGGQPGPLPCVPLGLAHPLPGRLRRAPDLLRDGIRAWLGPRPVEASCLCARSLRATRPARASALPFTTGVLSLALEPLARVSPSASKLGAGA